MRVTAVLGLAAWTPLSAALYLDWWPSKQAVFGSPDASSRPDVAFPSRPSHKTAGFIAIGDSYSAGIGTGVNGTEDPCRHGQGAYPKLILDDLTNTEGGDNTTFQFLSCTGSTIDDVLSGDPSQIDQFNTTDTADFALLSVGGNDLGFFEIMNSCIFRFYSFYSGTCEAALKRSAEALAGPDFEHRLRLAIMEILDRVHWEKRLWFTITVTGYARFFNEDTDDCDDYSFGIWWRGPKLKKELRKQMNHMVVDVNAKIKRSIDAINSAFTEPRVFFVDYDDAFEGHRFCEPGVTEPDYARNETWFFLVGGPDNGDNRTTPEEPPDSSHDMTTSPTSLLDDTCLAAAEKSGDWDQLAPCMMASVNNPGLRIEDGELQIQHSMWYVPTYYGKTFHPRSDGHKAIRDRVYKLWEDIGPISESRLRSEAEDSLEL